jgi:radical S-adenosyl methionine domain-containing protein 2
VQKALSQVEWDQEMFRARGGVFDWSRLPEVKDMGCGNALSGVDMKDLEF